MAQLDQIFVCNPTKKDFEVRFDSEVYYLAAGEERLENKFLARHMAKHLSDREMTIQFYKFEQEQKRKKEKVPETLKGMTCLKDNPERRIVLYQILKSKKEVEEVLKGYPQFGGRDRAGQAYQFEPIGDIQKYEDFVDNIETPEVKAEEPEPEEKPKRGRPKKEL